ncbi:MAG: hypothetical protein RLZZ227_529 [Pseudomonadota bacterium]|jgi:hypothetical protein
MKAVLRHVAVIGFLLAALPASAHHSFAMYDQTELRSFTGKLTRFIPGANHAQLLFEVLDADGATLIDSAGKPVMWGVEMGPAARIAKQGVTPDNFPNGTIISVSLNPLRDGRTFGAMPMGSGGVIHCGMQFPEGGCNAETGTVYLAENN